MFRWLREKCQELLTQFQVPLAFFHCNLNKCLHILAVRVFVIILPHTVSSSVYQLYVSLYLTLSSTQHTKQSTLVSSFFSVFVILSLLKMLEFWQMMPEAQHPCPRSGHLSHAWTSKTGFTENIATSKLPKVFDWSSNVVQIPCSKIPGTPSMMLPNAYFTLGLVRLDLGVSSPKKDVRA